MKHIISFISVVLLAFGVASAGFALEPAARPASSEAAQKTTSLININTADAATLTQLKGVGLKKAEAIVAWRKANGQFKNLEQLTDVKGIGEAILKANKDKITI